MRLRSWWTLGHVDPRHEVRGDQGDRRDMSDSELGWLSAWELADKVRSGELSITEVADDFLARVERLDPMLHSFITVSAERFRDEARSLPGGPSAEVS